MLLSLAGTVERLDPALPEGAAPGAPRSLVEHYRLVIGVIKDMLPDAASNIDRDLYDRHAP